MAKIAQVSAKYIVHATIQIDGVVDRPDVVGAIFGQTEGLLGADLELRELQRSGRIGRIEVNVETKAGKTRGEIIMPSSLDKAETAIVGAALEVIQRIGPCNAKILVQSIEDVRISKRQQVIERAKDLLKNLMDSVLPDSQELADEVAHSVRVMEITEYGRERLPAGPAVEDSDDIIIVEGRADVLNLLKHGFKNAVALNGTNVPPTIIQLTKEKVVTLFVDGDRGGQLIIQEVLGSGGEIDFICKAPDGKEVEELTKKEIHKGLRGKVAAEQFRMESGAKRNNESETSAMRDDRPARDERRDERSRTRDDSRSRDDRTRSRDDRPRPRGREDRESEERRPRKRTPTDEEKAKFATMLEDLIGTRGAYLLDEKLNILGKVPVSELQSTIRSLRSGIHAVIFDGQVDKELVTVADRANVPFVVGMSSRMKNTGSVNVMTTDDLS